jgi:hypothetical protein
LDFEVVHWHIVSPVSRIFRPVLVKALFEDGLDRAIAVAASRWSMITISTVIAARGFCALLTNMLSAPAEIAELCSGNNGDFHVFSPGLVVYTENGGRKFV